MSAALLVFDGLGNELLEEGRERLLHPASCHRLRTCQPGRRRQSLRQGGVGGGRRALMSGLGPTQTQPATERVEILVEIPSCFSEVSPTRG